MIRLYCATGNLGKLAEFRLAAKTSAIEIEAIPGYKQIPPCDENGATFAENALLKARHYASHVDGLVFADDSGLVVDALGGSPGIYSARYSGADATDESNNRLLLEKLRGVENRTAAFVCAIALVNGDSRSAALRAVSKASFSMALAAIPASATTHCSTARRSGALSAKPARIGSSRSATAGRHFALCWRSFADSSQLTALHHFAFSASRSAIFCFQGRRTRSVNRFTAAIVSATK